jgi:hypothetical protein
MPQAISVRGSFPRRKQLSGPESALVSNAIKSGLPFFANSYKALFREPRMPTGFPDLLVVYCRRTGAGRPGNYKKLDITELKLLHHLWTARTTCISELVDRLLWSKKVVDACLDRLGNANLIRVTSTTVRVRRLQDAFILSKIIAIEAKITNWKEAIEQAVTNTWFASHSYILLPSNRVISRVSDQARKLGIGVLVFDGQYTKEILRPCPNKIPSSYGSWLINEWVVDTMTRKKVYDRHGCSSRSISRT